MRLQSTEWLDIFFCLNSFSDVDFVPFYVLFCNGDFKASHSGIIPQTKAAYMREWDQFKLCLQHWQRAFKSTLPLCLLFALHHFLQKHFVLLRLASKSSVVGAVLHWADKQTSLKPIGLKPLYPSIYSLSVTTYSHLDHAGAGVYLIILCAGQSAAEKFFNNWNEISIFCDLTSSLCFQVKNTGLVRREDWTLCLIRFSPALLFTWLKSATPCPKHVQIICNSRKNWTAF